MPQERCICLFGLLRPSVRCQPRRAGFRGRHRRRRRQSAYVRTF